MRNTILSVAGAAIASTAIIAGISAIPAEAATSPAKASHTAAVTTAQPSGGANWTEFAVYPQNVGGWADCLGTGAELQVEGWIASYKCLDEGTTAIALWVLY